MTIQTPRRRRVQRPATPPTPAEIAAQEAERERYVAQLRDDRIVHGLVFNAAPDLPTEGDEAGEWPTDLAGLVTAQADHDERRVRAAWGPDTGEHVLARAIDMARNEAAYQTARLEGAHVAEMGTVDPEKVYVGFAETYRGALAREKREATNKAKAYAQTVLAKPMDAMADDLVPIVDWFWEGYHSVVDDQYTERTAPSPALAAEIERLFAAWQA